MVDILLFPQFSKLNVLVTWKKNNYFVYRSKISLSRLAQTGQKGA